LRYVDADGQPTNDAPSYLEALVQLEKAERRLAGADLAVAKLEADHERDALNDPHRPEVELLHKCWKVACKRRRELDTNDREQMGRAVKRLGLLLCIEAIAGAAYDPHTRQLRNGDMERYDDLSLTFRSESKVHDFARRAPRGWTPDVEAIAVIGQVDVAWVRAKLGIKNKETQ
jgi:hypothetical protein